MLMKGVLLIPACRGRDADGTQRFPQLVLGLGGDHVVQILYKTQSIICRSTEKQIANFGFKAFAKQQHWK